MRVVFSVNIAICRTFAAATLACHFTSSGRACVPPFLSGRARLHEGWRRQFRVTQAKRKRKRNKISLWINTIRLTVMENTQK